jgi:hypothetical protein
MLLETSTKSWADLMAAFWVQRLYTLPIIIENIGMGNEPPQRGLPAEAVDQLGEFTFRIITVLNGWNMVACPCGGRREQLHLLSVGPFLNRSPN